MVPPTAMTAKRNAPVTDTAKGLRWARTDAPSSRTPRRVTPGAPDFDTCFCLSDTRQPLREVLTLVGKSGVSMQLATTEPAVQIYDARDARRPGRGGKCRVRVHAWFREPADSGVRCTGRCRCTRAAGRAGCPCPSGTS